MFSNVQTLFRLFTLSSAKKFNFYFLTSTFNFRLLSNFEPLSRHFRPSTRDSHLTSYMRATLAAGTSYCLSGDFSTKFTGSLWFLKFFIYLFKSKLDILECVSFFRNFRRAGASKIAAIRDVHPLGVALTPSAPLPPSSVATLAHRSAEAHVYEGPVRLGPPGGSNARSRGILRRDAEPRRRHWKLAIIGAIIIFAQDHRISSSRYPRETRVHERELVLLATLFRSWSRQWTLTCHRGWRVTWIVDIVTIDFFGQQEVITGCVFEIVHSSGGGFLNYPNP